MTSCSNFPWKLAGIAGIGLCSVSSIGYLVLEWLRFRETSSKVLFASPLVCGPNCRKINCPGPSGVANDQIFEEIVKRINNSKFSIDVCIYVITCVKVAQALRRAKKRGVSVRMIADNSLAFSTGSQITDLMEDIRVVLFSHEDGLMHHKFCLIDAPPGKMDTVSGGSVKSAMKSDKTWFSGKSECESDRQSVLITGSLNWTMRGVTGNFENVYITSNGASIRAYRDEFQRIWAHLNVETT